MNLKTILSAALLAGGALFIVGCAEDERRDNTGHERYAGDVIEDAAITTKVKAALLAEKGVKSRDIKVKTFDGVVQLSGFVSTQWQIDRAEEVAAGVEGVRSVRNDLIHKHKTHKKK